MMNDIRENIYVAKSIIKIVSNTERPMLMYKSEKDIVVKALREYISRHMKEL